MRFHILGPPQVSGPAGEVALGGRKQRTVLAVLLANAGRLVPLEYLVEAVWDSYPPPTAKRQVQNTMAALRRLLGPEPAIVTSGPGYRIELGEDDLDARVFAARVARGRELAGRGEAGPAAAELRSALALWRGPALHGLTGRVPEAIAAGLEDRRLGAIEERVDLDLALGRHGDLVGELTELVAADPLRERLAGQLMLALNRSGRQADALRVYQRAKARLADELGVDPGAELQRTYAEILVGAGPVRRAGCHLPRAVPDFVGRSAIQARLAAVAARMPAILAIEGMAGVGKTTLAVRLAHQLTGRYPDAQLYVDLHGHADREPDDPGAALSALLRQIGVPPKAVPERVEDRVARWHAELAGRRALVLLDNAAGSRHVAPLLPGASETLVIVTSRRMLAGLDGGTIVSLDVLPAADAAELLRRIVGDRAAAAPEATAELARLCGHLPLALRLAAARLVRRPAWSVDDLNERLRAGPGRLRHLAAEDRTVSAAIALSYRHLDDATRWVFRALGAHPPGAFDRYAAAALTGLGVSEVDDTLQELVDAYLLETPAAGRYRLHDLLREYAATLLAADPPERSEGTLRRLLTHYLHATANASAHFERASTRETLPLDEPPPTVPSFVDDTGAAVAWLDANWLTVVAVITLADAGGHDTHTWRLARALWPYIYRNGHNNELIGTHRRALDAAGRLGDTAAVATIHNYLASGYANTANYELTELHLREAYAARHRLGDRRGVVATLNNLALLQLYGACRPHDALRSCQEALELAERTGAEHDRYLCFRTLGFAYRMLGRYDEALACLHRALTGFQRSGQPSWRSVITHELGGVHAAAGDHLTAAPLLREALGMKQQEGNRAGAAMVLSELGEVYQTSGLEKESSECHLEALAQTSELDQSRPAVLNAYGRTLLARGDREQALMVHRQALAAVELAGNRYQRAKAHEGIGASLPEGAREAAVRHWGLALEIYADMGVPEAARVRERLAEQVPGR